LRRGEQRERVRFEPLSLLAVDEVTTLIAARLRELEGLAQRDSAGETIANALANVRAVKPTVVVCDAEELKTLADALVVDGIVENAEEAEAAATARFQEAAHAVCPTIERLVAAARDMDDGELTTELGDDRAFLLLVAGLQTGVTLQHLVVEIQDAVQGDTDIAGLVLHAHPHDSAAWGSVRNTFGGRRNTELLALWLTYLPARSPFGEEHELLSSAQDAWFDGARFGARELWQQRMAWTSPAQPDGTPAPETASPLWSTEPMKLRPTSRYGRLDDRRTVAAMGAALNQSLDNHDRAGAPEWVQIDLPNAFRSYFDALLHASLLRWVPPSRAWWGSSNECQSLIDELRGRFADSPPDWRLLLAELLLGSAMGKVPEVGVDAVLTHAERELDQAVLDGGEPAEGHGLGLVELGVILVRNLRTGPTTAESANPETTADPAPAPAAAGQA
jgi:hypothetical protein